MRRGLLLLAILARQASAQTDRATLTGVVTDPSEASLGAARVTIKSVATGSAYSLLTNSSGTFVVGSLPVGQYTAAISATGFQTLQFEQFTLRVGETRVLNASLPVQTAGTTVQVTSAAQDLNWTSGKSAVSRRARSSTNFP